MRIPAGPDELGPSLKALRQVAGLTQEELAERAGISARTVSDVERGIRAAVHADTARRLAAALRLQDRALREFEALARGHAAGPRPGPAERRLPAPPTRLLGRAEEVARIGAALRGSDVRLLTLTGPGGIGKTRLAVEVANQIGDAFADGVFFVSLGDLKEASLVAPELAKSIGVVETGDNLEELLIRRLAGRRTLVVLDTFEHLTPAVPLIYSVLLRCPEATFLVTSRSALRLRGEHEFTVPTLAMPAEVSPATAAEVIGWPATALFWERATAIRGDLVLDPESAQLVFDICRKLDGLPLAIELAAARIRHLPLAAIRDQLDSRLKLLVGGQQDLPVRQRTIRDTVAWSHDLLKAPEQSLFRRLSVFAGGWGLEAVADVCAPAGMDDPLTGISTLVDQSLVLLSRGRSEARYEMLDVVREYAAARLAAAGEAEDAARRHALHYLALAEEAERNLVRAGHAHWFQRLELERGNLRRALAWTIERCETTLALRYTVALWRYWRRLGEFEEGRRWADACLAVPGPASPSLRAKALWASSALAFRQGDHHHMARLAAEAIPLARQSEDAVDLRNALTIEGMVAMCEGRYEDALEPYRRGVDICRGLGVSWELATSYLNLGTAFLHSGLTDDAIHNLRDGLRVYRELGDDIFAARTTNALAHAALARNDLGEADRLAREALLGAWEQGEREGTADGLTTLAAVAAAGGEPLRAATLAGASAAISETIAYQPARFEASITGPLLDEVREKSLQDWNQAWHSGRSLGSDAAVAYALDRSPLR